MTTAELALPDAGADTRALHMIRADLDIREFHRWAGARGLISRTAFDEGYAMHCLLVESFGELAPKPFRVIIPPARGGRAGTLYGYALCEAGDLQNAAATFCDPLQAKILPASSIDSKPMPTEWRHGARIGFEALLRPTARLQRCVNVTNRRRQSKPTECKNGCNRMGCNILRGETVCKNGCAERHCIIERDAFQAEAERYDRGEMPRSREQVYTDWLRKRLESRGAARLEGATLAMFQRTRAIRKLHRPPSEGPHALMRGTMTISDPAEFARLVAGGIGRHKAYGYGMLLLRPPQIASAR